MAILDGVPDSLEARVLKKVTWRILPFVMLLYFISFVDRVNIGFAALTMNHDLGFSKSVYALGASILFLGYFLFEVPSNMILHRIGARIWIARVMISWGLISAAMALVQGPLSFYLLRFLLGVAEAGFFPGVILYLTYWFPARKRAGATAMFMAGAPISTARGSPVSAALLGMHGVMGLKGWQWMFLVEGAPAIIFGIVVLFFLTDRPIQARWLAEDERAWLIGAMAREKTSASHPNLWQALRLGLFDGRVLMLALIYFGTSAGLYVLGLWSPLIISELGLSTMQVGWLNAIPGIVAVVAMILWSAHSDRKDERVWHVVFACVLAAAGLFYAGIAVGLLGILAALTIVNIGVSASKPPLWSLSTLFLSGPAAAVGIANINALGNLGGFVGPYMVGLIKDWTGSYMGGLYFTGGLLVISALGTLLLARSQRLADSAREP